MDRMLKAKPRLFHLPMAADWRDWTLADLHPSQGIEISRDGRATIHTTVAELVRVARMPETMTLGQVEWAFSLPRNSPEPGAVVPIWKMPR